MAKQKPNLPGRTAQETIKLFPALAVRRRRPLILSRYLRDEAEKMIHKGEHQDRAHETLIKWIDLAAKGHIFEKETSVDADFLLEVFGAALGHRPFTESPDAYELQRNFTVPGVGVADEALGNFTPLAPQAALAVIEFKDADTDLDRDKFNGRTAVQQCWDYLNALPECPWGIVSNFVSFRLYHRDKTPLCFEEFQLADLKEIKDFRQFYCLFERGGLVRSVLGQPPRAVTLLRLSDERQRNVGDILYDEYSDNRTRLIQYLHFDERKPLETAIRVAQKILDRIIFVAFCEDRGLLPVKCIDNAYRTLPPFSKVRNPRWRNFLDLFHAVDQGHEQLELPTGYNGGLFAHDPDVNELQLDDRWTRFFHSIGGYDFRDEVNVDVLGHIFEKSITELEKLRTVGLFGLRSPLGSGLGGPAMAKSALRKRFGIYYTPVTFTRFLIDQTLGRLIDERFASIRASRGLTPEQLEDDPPGAASAAHWRDCLAALRQIRVCDPACGSGAFLIQAYDGLEERYLRIVEKMLETDIEEAEALVQSVPDIILAENLFGVDLSREAVEITQLALWLRSARRGKTLADLSHNIICGNSLVADPAADPRAVDWAATFPGVFARGEAGFDCVVGNPPWERLKLQEREFFAFTAPAVAGAVSAATRRRLIAAIETEQPELHAQYLAAKTGADRTLEYVRTSGRYPLTGKGDTNTYAVFAELARKLLAPRGRAGLLVPSGIATDNTTKEFFAELVESKRLVGLYDFENKAPIFRDVHRSFKFCAFLTCGDALTSKAADFAFFAQSIDDLEEQRRHIKLTAADLRLINPNTRTCPIFRSRRDAELTKAIYRRVPVLVDRNRREGGNPWGVRFVRMFDQTNDAELFTEPEQLQSDGFRLAGNRWTKGEQVFLPLYEAKMIQSYDHRAASVVTRAGNWMRQGQTEATTLIGHQNPEYLAQPRWWVNEVAVLKSQKGERRSGFIGFKDVTSPTNQRTMIAAAIPWAAVTNHFPLLLTAADTRLEMCLLANLNSLILDYVARQKIGGVTLNFFIVEQLPLFPPARYDDKCPWSKRVTLKRWVSERVLKLSCTSEDMLRTSERADFAIRIHPWNHAERAELIAELDAAFFLLYGIDRDDTAYMLSTFSGVSHLEKSFAEFASAADSVLAAYDRLLKAARSP